MFKDYSKLSISDFYLEGNKFEALTNFKIWYYKYTNVYVLYQAGELYDVFYSKEELEKELQSIVDLYENTQDEDN